MSCVLLRFRSLDPLPFLLLHFVLTSIWLATYRLCFLSNSLPFLPSTLHMPRPHPAYRSVPSHTIHPVSFILLTSHHPAFYYFSSRYFSSAFRSFHRSCRARPAYPIPSLPFHAVPSYIPSRCATPSLSIIHPLFPSMHSLLSSNPCPPFFPLLAAHPSPFHSTRSLPPCSPRACASSSSIHSVICAPPSPPEPAFLPASPRYDPLPFDYTLSTSLPALLPRVSLPSVAPSPTYSSYTLAPCKASLSAPSPSHPASCFPFSACRFPFVPAVIIAISLCWYQLLSSSSHPTFFVT
ncbi:hypothetical protein DFH06DRAFT_1180162 [Mycena polygramma]|nr:hypothetical protein DFH06DRAFT_1180162 [Mycena polygramma]